MRLTVVWFRTDLRLSDNPALQEAIQLGDPIIPLYIHSPEDEAPWTPGAASNWWLHHALESLDQELKGLGSKLILAHGPASEVLQSLVHKHKPTAIFWNRRYEPAIIKRDANIKKSLSAQGLNVQSFNASLLYEPHTVKNKSNKPFKVFTPFWRHCKTTPPRPPINTNLKELKFPGKFPKSLNIKALELLPAIPWDKTFYSLWTPTPQAALKRLKSFNKQSITQYPSDRDIPGIDGTSALSPYLHFGQLSPYQVFKQTIESPGSQTYLSEIGWREFAYHLLYHFPQTTTEPFNPNFAKFPWKKNQSLLNAWQRGETGYPIVDAGMRQLWTTGWMHNRVRMIVASFLTKHLLLHWKHGAEWFWDTLLDADLASNTLGWQWTAGCGADAAPYFRIFNPMTQGSKFDPEGAYVKQFIPELKKLPPKYIHAPWTAPNGLISLGKDYPKPIVDHPDARNKALHAYEKMKAFT